MKQLTVFLFLFFSISLLNAGTYSGGSGAELDPYQIANTDDLIELSNTSGDWGAYFIQTVDITFNADESQVDWNGDGNINASDATGFSPIGNLTDKFTGEYDGQNHTIRNLYIDRSSQDFISFFGYTHQANISNIGIFKCNISGKDYTGGMIGFSNLSIIQNSFADGSIEGNDYIGGLIGNCNGDDISNSYSSALINGVDWVGGIIGYIENSDITNSYSTGNVSGNSRVGGFIGSNNTSLITNSYSTGNVNGNSSVGGFAGYSEGGNIQFCYSTGTVTGNSIVGGFIGDYIFGAMSGNFWIDKQTLDDTAYGDSPNITETTDNDMKTKATFTGAGWDFADDWVMSSTITFNGYPTLKWTGAYSVEPISNQIATLMNLVWLAEDNTRWSASYTQTSDIIMWTTPSWDGNKGFSPIGNGTTTFSGNYDGQGYLISNLYINRSTSNTMGFFGLISGATISNVNIINCDITGQSYVGGLVGASSSSSTVSKSYSNGTVNGTTSVGGLVGINQFSSEISNSYSNAIVSGTTTNVGGLAGYNINTCVINNCYSTGSVNGPHNAGGLLGSNNNSTVTNSFWDTETSGQATSGGGTGKSSSEMKSQQTFIDAGWDLLGESENGTSNYWGINLSDNDAYPFLAWQGYDNKQFNFSNFNMSNIDINSATANATITLNSSEPEITKVGFVYSTSSNPIFIDGNISEIGSWENETYPFSLDLTSLTQSQVYQIKPYLQTVDGYIYYGAIQSFATIPTLGEWGLIVLGSLFALGGGWFVWRRMV